MDYNDTFLHLVSVSSENDDLQFITYGSFSALVGISGSFGNALVIFAVLTTKKLRTPNNVFILSLAFADLSISALMEPVRAYNILIDKDLYSKRPLLCSVIANVCFVSCTCSVWNIGAIAINRYVFICKNRCYNTAFTWSRTIAYAIAIWVICFVADLTNIFGWGGYSYDPKFLVCTYDRLASYSHVLFMVNVFISIPMIVIMLCYTAIFYTLRRSSVRLKNSHGNRTVPKQTHSKSDIKLLKMVFTIFVAFVLCWSLYMLLLLIDFADRYPPQVYKMAGVLSHTNSALNSIIYGVLNKNFRDAYRRILCCGEKRKENIRTLAGQLVEMKAINMS